MKLYATVTSERDSRPARKGGDSFVQVVLTHGNMIVLTVVQYTHTIEIYDYKGNLTETIHKAKP